MKKEIIEFTDFLLICLWFTWLILTIIHILYAKPAELPPWPPPGIH